MIYLSFTLSVLLNIFLFWYIHNILKRLLYVSDNLAALNELIEEYQAHLESLYDLEMYYGDQTLKELIRHTKYVIESLDSYKEIYVLSYDTQEDEVVAEIEEEGADENEET